MGMKVEGLDNVLRNLKKLDPKEWKKGLHAEMRKDNKEVRQAMKAAAPSASGKLKRNIRTAAWTKKRSNKDFALYVRTGPTLKGKGRVWYAHFSELGTTDQQAQSYVAETFNKYKGPLTDSIERSVRSLVKKANGK